jgi:FixJ family two-component response regulator
MSLEKILFVDDEISLLEGMENQFRKLYDVNTAVGGEMGLKLMAEKGPFAVVVSDMRMPGMDGVRFLAAVSEKHPDTVRIMLTGNADIDTAIDAVNKGHIFRFVSKPCSFEPMGDLLDSAVRQYRLIVAERELLDKTLKGAVKTLVDVLALANPAAFSRAVRIKHFTLQLATALQFRDTWMFEIAALLSQIGYITIPAETLEKIVAGEGLTPAEQNMVTGQAEVARSLIANIPRLEVVADIISRQAGEFTAAPGDLHAAPIATVGAWLVAAALAFDTQISAGVSPERAVDVLSDSGMPWPKELLKALATVNVPTYEKVVKYVTLHELRGGMVLAEAITATNGSLIVAKGQEVNEMLRRRLENFAAQGSIGNSVRVYIEGRH